MDLDQTQAIDLEFSDDEDKNEEEKQQVAYLLFPEQPGVDTSLKMPLFEGENIIGRDDRADVCLRNKALSKQHALVEIHNFSALICDLGSLNKTRKGKLFLKPHVRYNLETNEKLLFGNIRANFCWSEPLHYIHKDSSSDTESESMLPVQKEEENEEPHKELPQNKTDVSLETEKKDGGKEENLQLCETGNICKQVVRTESEVFGASDGVLTTRRHPGEEDDCKETDDTTVIVTTTQPFQPDGEDESDKIAMMMAETQPYQVDSTDKDNDETGLMMAETQPYQVDSTDKDNDETELMMAATQPYEDNSSNEHQETTSQMAVVGESVKTFSKREVMMEPTQMYLDDDDETDVEGSGANDEVLEMETQAFDEEINCKETKDGEVLTTGADDIKPLVFPINGRDIGNTKNKSFNSGIDFLENSDDDEVLDTPPQASACPAEEEDRSDVNFQTNANVRDQKQRFGQSVSRGVEVEFEARLMNCSSLIEDSLSKQDETLTESILCPATQKKSGIDTEDDEDGFAARAQTPPYVEELTDTTTLVAETPPRLTESKDKPCFVVLPRLSADDDGCIQFDGHLSSLKKTDKGEVYIKPLKSKSFTENILSRDKNRDELNNERLDLVRESALALDQSCTYFSMKKDTTTEKCYSESEMLGNDTSKEMLAAEEKADFVKIQRNIMSEKTVRQDATMEGKEEKSKSYDSSTFLENMGKETNENMEIEKPYSNSDEQEERITEENKHQVLTDVKVSNLPVKWNKRKQNLKLSKHKDVVSEEERHSLGGFSGRDRSTRSENKKANKQNQEVHFKKVFYTNSGDITSLESGHRKSKTNVGEELENSRTADTNSETFNTSLESGKRRGGKSKTNVGEELENSRTADTNSETLNTSLESGKRRCGKSKTNVVQEESNQQGKEGNLEKAEQTSCITTTEFDLQVTESKCSRISNGSLTTVDPKMIVSESNRDVSCTETAKQGKSILAKRKRITKATEVEESKINISPESFLSNNSEVRKKISLGKLVERASQSERKNTRKTKVEITDNISVLHPLCTEDNDVDTSRVNSDEKSVKYLSRTKVSGLSATEVTGSSPVDIVLNSNFSRVATRSRTRKGKAKAASGDRDDEGCNADKKTKTLSLKTESNESLNVTSGRTELEDTKTSSSFESVSTDLRHGRDDTSDLQVERESRTRGTRKSALRGKQSGAKELNEISILMTGKRHRKNKTENLVGVDEYTEPHTAHKRPKNNILMSSATSIETVSEKPESKSMNQTILETSYVQTKHLELKCEKWRGNPIAMEDYMSKDDEKLDCNVFFESEKRSNRKRTRQTLSDSFPCGTSVASKSSEVKNRRVRKELETSSEESESCVSVNRNGREKITGDSGTCSISLPKQEKKGKKSRLNVKERNGIEEEKRQTVTQAKNTSSTGDKIIVGSVKHSRDTSPTLTPKSKSKRGSTTSVIDVTSQDNILVSNSEFFGPSPRRNRSVKSLKPKVMFTGLNDEDNGRKIVSSLEWDLVDSVMECSHLVTDKFHRTVKMLCCVAKGIPIVSIEWLQKCCESRAFIDHSLYVINDKKAEKHHNFSLAETLKKAAEQPLLTGWSVHVTPNVVPSPDQMKEIILCAGGKFVRNMPARLAPHLVIVSTPKDVKLLKHAVKCGIPVVETEFILTGLLRYELNTTIFSLNI